MADYSADWKLLLPPVTSNDMWYDFLYVWTEKDKGEYKSIIGKLHSKI